MNDVSGCGTRRREFGLSSPTGRPKLVSSTLPPALPSRPTTTMTPSTALPTELAFLSLFPPSDSESDEEEFAPPKMSSKEERIQRAIDQGKASYGWAQAETKFGVSSSVESGIGFGADLMTCCSGSRTLRSLPRRRPRERSRPETKVSSSPSRTAPAPTPRPLALGYTHHYAPTGGEDADGRLLW